MSLASHHSCGKTTILSVWLVLAIGSFLAACDNDPGTVSNIPSKVEILRGDDVWKLPGDTTSLAVRVLGRDGEPLEGTTVRFRVEKGAATVESGEVATDAKGVASTVLNFGDTTGEVSVQAWPKESKSNTVQFRLGVIGGGRHLTLISGKDQKGTVGQPLSEPLVVAVVDSFGHPVSEVPVSFQVEEGDGEISPGNVVTGDSGRASTTWTLGTSVQESQLVSASLPKSNHSIFFRAEPKAGPPADYILASKPSSCGEAGTTLDRSFRVEVSDQYGNPVDGALVSFTVTAGDGSVSSREVETQRGTATSRLTLGEEDEMNRVEIQVEDLSPTTFEAISLFPVALQTAKPTINTIELGWEESRNTSVDAYWIHRTESRAQPPEHTPPHIKVSATDSLTATDSEVAPGATYYYAIETIVSDECTIYGDKHSARAGRYFSFEAPVKDAVYDEDDGRLYVSVEGSTELRVLDTDNLEEVDRLSMGTQPNRLALSLDGDELLVSLSERAAVQAIDRSTFTKEEYSLKMDLTGPPTYDVVEVQPGKFAASVAHVSGDGWGQIVSYNRSKDSTSHLAGATTMGADAQLSVGPDQRYMYVADHAFSPDELFKLDLSEPEGPIVAKSRNVGYTWDVAPSPDGNHVFTSGTPLLDDEAFALNASDLSVIEEIKSGMPTFGSTSDLIYMVNVNKVRSFNVSSFEKVLDMNVQFEDVYHVDVSEENERIYVVTDNEVFAIKIDI